MEYEVIDLKENKGRASFLYALLVVDELGNEQVLCLPTKENPTRHDKTPVFSLKLEDIENVFCILAPYLKEAKLKCFIGKFQRIANY